MTDDEGPELAAGVAPQGSTSTAPVTSQPSLPETTSALGARTSEHEADAAEVHDAPADDDSRTLWRDSPERMAASRKYFVLALGGSIGLYAGIGVLVAHDWVQAHLGLSLRLGSYLGILMLVVGIASVGYAATSLQRARQAFLTRQLTQARGQADQALEDINGPDDIQGMIRANRKQMDAYEALARSQARTSYRASQVAMGFGLLIVATGVCVTIFSSSSATKYSAALVTASGAATGGFISRTFLSVQQNAVKQMNFYFQQPLVQSYLLQAERLSSRLTTSRDEVLRHVLESNLQQAGSNRESADPPKRTVLRRRDPKSE